MSREGFEQLQGTLVQRMGELANYLARYEAYVTQLSRILAAPHERRAFCNIEARLTSELGIHVNATRTLRGPHEATWTLRQVKPTSIREIRALIDELERDIFIVVRSYLDIAALGHPLQVHGERPRSASVH
jgi:hypothetical protein